MLTKKQIQHMADIIVEKFHPEKIILFGSYARGDATEDSDVDFIVIKDTYNDVREEAVNIMNEMWDVPVATDIFVRTKEQFAQEKKYFWSVFAIADKEGEILYEQVA
ncbi:MAG: nucleotidyltransferase domain-containing protein [Verrucomicrobiota bacterium]|nr:nucleotidyltransferase domain-containing protein [Verrucomicrobiota bacterium]